MPDFTTYDWAQLFPGTSPSARLGHAMVWDGTRVILFGGNTSAFGVARSAETWEYAGGTWTLLSPATSPPARAFHRMVWDGSRILMFGGAGSSDPFLDDLWEFSGGTWTQLFPATSPDGRQYHDMIWDGSRVLMFGGLNAAGVTFNDETWEYVAANWNQLAPADSPPNVPGSGGPGPPTGRWRHRMAWDGAQVVLLGGRSASNVYPANPEYESGGNTWVYAAADWSQPGPATEPGERYSHSICATDDDGKTIAYSGDVSPTGSLGEIVEDTTWIYDGVTWVEMAEAINPGPRLDSDMVWADDRIILFGGNFYTSATVHDVDAETWEYAGPPTPPPPPTPIAASISHIFGAN